MYQNASFRDEDPRAVIAFMNAHPFAFVTGVNAKRQPVATQVPVLVEERKESLFLIGHFQRKTDHQLAFEQHPEALVVFTGAHSYVSASWYTDPQQASTWNYMSVHARGALRFLDEEALYQLLKQTTGHFENNPHSPSLMDQLPEDYISRHMKGIVAFEIEVTSIEHVFKLSQNRDEKSYETIIHQLNGQGGEAAAVAQQMEQRKSKLFP